MRTRDMKAFTAREDAVLDDLRTYEAMQLALDDAASVLWGKVA